MRMYVLATMMGVGVICVAPSILAQTQGGVIRGDTNINVNAENVNTIATGSGNSAKTSIGSVKGGTRESTNVTVDVKNVSNVVTGRGKKGCINIGTKGADPDCK